MTIGNLIPFQIFRRSLLAQFTKNSINLLPLPFFFYWHNSHAIKLTLSKYTIQWFLVLSQGWATITVFWFEDVSITPKRNLVFICSHSPSPTSCSPQLIVKTVLLRCQELLTSSSPLDVNRFQLCMVSNSTIMISLWNLVQLHFLSYVKS